MEPISMVLSNGEQVILNAHNNPVVAQYLARPKAFPQEMVRQINELHYYDEFFQGRSDLVFLDLGANIGLVSLFAYPSCRSIIAVEAEPNTCAVMKGLLEPFPRIECLNFALSAWTGTVSLSVNEKNWTCHTITNPIAKYPSKRVSSISWKDLLDLCRLDRIDVCKVDVEGAEVESLTVEAIRSANVGEWYVEVHKTPTHTRDENMDLMQSRFEECGLSAQRPRENCLIVRRASADESPASSTPSPSDQGAGDSAEARGSV